MAGKKKKATVRVNPSTGAAVSTPPSNGGGFDPSSLVHRLRHFAMGGPAGLLGMAGSQLPNPLSHETGTARNMAAAGPFGLLGMGVGAALNNRETPPPSGGTGLANIFKTVSNAAAAAQAAQPAGSGAPFNGTINPDLTRVLSRSGNPNVPSDVGTPVGGQAQEGKLAEALKAASAADPTDTLLQQSLAALGAGPNEASYVQPYDQAAQTARDSYGAAVPVINQTYADLANKLAAARSGASADAAKSLAEMQAQQQGIQGQVAGLNQQVLADIQRQGGDIQLGQPTAAVQQMAGAQQAGLADQGALQQRYMQDVASSRDASMADRAGSADMAKAAGLANAQNNLDSILNQIGIQRAGAERQYANDAADFGRQQAQTRLAFLNQKLQSQADQAKLDHQTQLNTQKAIAAAAKGATETAGDQWQMNELPQFAAQFPKTAGALGDIIGEASKAKGAARVAAVHSALAAMQAKPDEFAQHYGFVPDAGTWQVLQDAALKAVDPTEVTNEDKLLQALALQGIDLSQFGG